MFAQTSLFKLHTYQLLYQFTLTETNSSKLKYKLDVEYTGQRPELKKPLALKPRVFLYT